jgi:Family of unknown function (DUF6172)
MKKTYSFHADGKHPDRVLDAIKHDIRRYQKRCRAAPLPEGVDFWDFDCRFGADIDSATPVHTGELMKLIDAAAQAGQASAFVQLDPKHGHRVYVPGQAPAPEEGDDDGLDDAHDDAHGAKDDGAH